MNSVRLMASWTAFTLSELTRALPVSTRETVARDTPAYAAMSAIVTLVFPTMFCVCKYVVREYIMMSASSLPTSAGKHGATVENARFRDQMHH